MLQRWRHRRLRPSPPQGGAPTPAAPPSVHLGPHSYSDHRLRTYLGDTAEVHVGAFTSIADDVQLVPGGNHRIDWISTYPFRVMFDLPGALEDGHPASKGDIRIGNDVWIGTGATILSGVVIGDGAVVGAGAVVSRDVRPYSVVVGNPAEEVRRRFSDEQVEALLRVKWWDWPIERVLRHVDVLCSADVQRLLEIAADPGEP